MQKRFDIPFMIPARRFADKIYKRLNAMEIPKGMEAIYISTRIDKETVVFLLNFKSKELTYNCEPDCPKWSALDCNEITENVKSNCNTITSFNHGGTILSKYKIYVNGHRDFFNYVLAIKSGAVTKAYNRKIWGVVLCNWNWVNHNVGKSTLITGSTDIDILHFKFVKIQNTQHH